MQKSKTVLAIAAVCLTLANANFLIAQEHKYGTPQEAFESYKLAVANNDYEQHFASTSPSFQKYLNFECLFALGMNDAKAGQKIRGVYVNEKKLEEIINSMGRPGTNQQSIDFLAACIDDKKGLFVDSMKYFRETKREEDSHKPGMQELSNLLVDGDFAKAKTIRKSIILVHGSDRDGANIQHEDERSTEIDVYFVKIGEHWRFAMPHEWDERKAPQIANAQDLERIEVESVTIRLSNGSEVEMPAKKIAGVMCGRGSAGLTVLWIQPMDTGGVVKAFTSGSKEYSFLTDLPLDNRLKVTKGEDDGESKPPKAELTALKIRLERIEKLLIELHGK